MRLPAALLCFLLALPGCTSSGAPQAAHSPRPSAAAHPASAAPPVVVDVLPEGFGGGFTSPSGNITCNLSSSSVTCSVRDQPWKPMPVQEGCTPGQWETVVQMNLTSTASLQGQCGRPDGGPPLPYGRGIQVGKLRCAMTTSGLDCLVLSTSQGFAVSRTGYRLDARGSRLAAAPAAAPTPVTTVPAGFWGWFESPSGNLRCTLMRDSAACTVFEHTWRPPGDAESCEYADGDADVVPAAEAFVAAGTANVYSTCRATEDAARLAYDRGYRLGAFTCMSLTSGMECRNRRTGHGFLVSKASYRVF